MIDIFVSKMSQTYPQTGGYTVRGDTIEDDILSYPLSRKKEVP